MAQIHLYSSHRDSLVVTLQVDSKIELYKIAHLSSGRVTLVLNSAQAVKAASGIINVEVDPFEARVDGSSWDDKTRSLNPAS